MKKEILAYTAGIIDGEGCIGINRGRRKGECIYHSLKIECAVTDRGVIEWLHRTFGGSTYFGKRPNRKPYYRWLISSKEGESFLRLIYPFLRIKRNQARLVFAFRKTFGKPGAVIGKKKYDAREEFCVRLSAIKRAV